jgi:arylsulfatase
MSLLDLSKGWRHLNALGVFREATQCCGLSATEGADVGLNAGTPVSLDYTNPFSFNGKVEKVMIDLKDDKAKAAEKDAIEQKQSESNLKRALAN